MVFLSGVRGYDLRWLFDVMPCYKGCNIALVLELPDGEVRSSDRAEHIYL